MGDLPKGKPILCVDFDGVIHSYSSGWKGARCIPDPPVDGAFDFLINSVEHFQVCIYSSRSRYLFGRRAMKRWLRSWFVKAADQLSDNALQSHDWTVWAKSLIGSWVANHWGMEPYPHDYIEAANALIRKIKFPTRKPPAFLQIDDRAITFTGTFPSVEEIKAFKPWNKK